MVTNGNRLKLPTCTRWLAETSAAMATVSEHKHLRCCLHLF